MPPRSDPLRNPIGDWLDRGGPARLVLACLVLALIYLATGRGGLYLATYQENATLVWPPTGLALAALLLGGLRLWPGIFLGVLCLSAFVGSPLSLSLGFALGNTLEAVVGAFLLRRLTSFNPSFARLTDVLYFVSLGGLVCTAISASVAVLTLTSLGELAGHRVPFTWLSWWLGDAGGALVFAPLLLVGVQGQPRFSRLLRRAELWSVLALLAVSSAFSFLGLLDESWAQLLLAFLPFPLCVWAGIRLGPRGAIAASFVVMVVAILGTARGFGPFAQLDIHRSVLLLWAYLISLGMVTMILAAAIAERETAEALSLRTVEERRSLELNVERGRRLEALGLLAGGVAHDFNNLLTVVLGNAEILAMELPGSAHYARNISDAAHKAADLCRQLLTYAGRGLSRTQPISLPALLSELERLLKVALPEAVRLDLQLADVPLVEGDSSQLSQLLINLLLNAGEAIGPAGGHVRIRAEALALPPEACEGTWVAGELADGPWVRLDVSDDGPGLAADVRGRIFDPFFSTKGPGRGLGMTTVLGIVKSHRGAITVDSQVGAGTTFSVWLPAATTVPGVPSRSVPGAAAPRGGTILLADDEELVRDVVSKHLQSAGWTVLTACDGEEALQVFAAHREAIEVALLDVRMPGRTGVEVLSELRAQRPALPVILATGFDAGQLEGVTGVPILSKPFERSELFGVLAEVLARAGDAGQSARRSPDAAAPQAGPVHRPPRGPTRPAGPISRGIPSAL